MKHYLVFCKDDQQWDEYVRKIEDKTEQSLTLNLENRLNSFIIHRHYGESWVFIKSLPDTKHDKYLTQIIQPEQIWLCTKEEFV